MFRSKMLEVRERKEVMKSIMKTIIRSTRLIIILAFLPALLSAAQAQAVDYKSTYKGVRYEQPRQHVEYKVASTASAPTVGFQSTSVYSSQFGNGEQSMLNSDGTVNNEAYGVGSSHHPGSIRRTGPGGTGPGDIGPGGNTVVGPGTPGGTLNKDDQQPLGDVMWPLILCACAYLVVRATRKEEKIG